MIEPKNILIIRTDRIGDVVLSLPLAEFVKKKYPDCKVSFLLREYTKDLAFGNPFIDDVIILNEKNGKPGISSNISLLKQKKFDTCITVYPTFQIALIVFLSGIKNRIGTGYRWYSIFFNSKVYEHRKYAEKHELEYNVNLLKKIGIDERIDRSSINFNLNINSKSNKKVSNELKNLSIDESKPIIVVHPGSGGSAVDLPIQKLKLFVDKLCNSGLQVLVTGSKQEFSLCEKISNGNSAANLAGKFSLSEMTALMQKSSAFVSNSTGPIHIAAALNKHSFGFYPNLTACLPKRWGPYSNKANIYMPETNCDDCKKQQCTKTECMNSIDIDKVHSDILNAIKSL